MADYAFIALTLAAQKKQSGGSSAAAFLPLILLFGVFYMFIMRPQQRRQKEQRDLLSSVKQGDKVVVAGGIQGTVRRVDDDSLSVQVADNVVLKVDKGSVSRKIQT